MTKTSRIYVYKKNGMTIDGIALKVIDANMREAALSGSA